MTATFLQTLRGRRRSAGAARPTVSVLINTLNRRDHLERTLLALRDQSYAAFEVVVVDGPSIDGTSEMLQRFAGTARVDRCTEANLGVSRNRGVALAAGEIVAFIDDDAIPPTDWLERLVEPYLDDADLAAVGGTVFDVPNGRIDWSLCTCDRLGSPVLDTKGPVDRYLGRGADPFVYLAGCNMSFRRTALDAIGGFNSLLAYGYDDVEVCGRLVDQGMRLALVEDAVVRHERAPSAVRDEHHQVRDPYSPIYSRAVFTLQTVVTPHRPADVRAMLDAWVEDWANLATHHVAEGVFDAAQAARFLDRARRGADDGFAAGLGVRPWHRIPPRQQRSFRPYHRMAG